MTTLRLFPTGLLTGFLGSLALVGAGCAAPRMTVVTGTTIGLKATPGNGQTRPPQVMFGYKRAEFAVVPTAGKVARKDTSDAFSALTTLFFSTHWFGETTLASFISTGHAARNIQEQGPEFNAAFAQETLGAAPEDIQNRRLALAKQWDALFEEDARKILEFAGVQVKTHRNSKESLADAIKDAQTTIQLTTLEAAFQRAR